MTALRTHEHQGLLDSLLRSLTQNPSQLGDDQLRHLLNPQPNNIPHQQRYHRLKQTLARIDMLRITTVTGPLGRSYRAIQFRYNMSPTDQIYYLLATHCISHAGPIWFLPNHIRIENPADNTYFQARTELARGDRMQMLKYFIIEWMTDTLFDFRVRETTRQPFGPHNRLQMQQIDYPAQGPDDIEELAQNDSEVGLEGILDPLIAHVLDQLHAEQDQPRHDRDD